MSSTAASPHDNRPIGITILALLQILGGFVACIAQAQLVGNLAHVSEFVGVPPSHLFIVFVFLAGLAFAAGLGMWFGKRWGWWCGAFGYVYAITATVRGLIFIHDLAEVADPGEMPGRALGYVYFKAGARLLVHSLILLYLFKRNVRRYFRVDNVRRSTAIGILVAMTVAILGALKVLPEVL